MTTAEQTQSIVNGVDTQGVASLATEISQDKTHGAFRFRVKNQWIDGAHSRSAIQGFFAGGEERLERQVHLVEADQPEFLGGQDTAPNPVEYLLHALASCLNVTLVYHAAVQGIELASIKTSAEGQMDARGFFGLSDEVAKGYSRIKVHMQVRSDADVETLTQLAMYSPVYEVVSKAVPVDFAMSKI